MPRRTRKRRRMHESRCSPGNQRAPPLREASPDRGPAVSYSLTTMWRERKRFLPGLVAIAFSTLLILFEGGLLVGQYSLTSAPIDHARADVWVGHMKNLSLDIPRPIPERWLSKVAVHPEVEQVERYIIRLYMLDPPRGPTGLCTVVGSSLE